MRASTSKREHFVLPPLYLCLCHVRTRCFPWFSQFSRTVYRNKFETRTVDFAIIAYDLRMYRVGKISANHQIDDIITLTRFSGFFSPQTLTLLNSDSLWEKCLIIYLFNYITALFLALTFNPLITTQLLSGNSSRYGTRNWTHPFQCDSNSIEPISLTIRSWPLLILSNWHTMKHTLITASIWLENMLMGYDNMKWNLCSI